MTHYDDDVILRAVAGCANDIVLFQAMPTRDAIYDELVSRAQSRLDEWLAHARDAELEVDRVLLTGAERGLEAARRLFPESFVEMHAPLG